MLIHPSKLVAFPDTFCKAQPEAQTGIALKRLVVVLCEGRGGQATFHVDNGKANPINCAVWRQRRVVRSISGAEFNGSVDRIEQMLVPVCILHQIYGSTAPPPPPTRENGRSIRTMINVFAVGHVRRHPGNIRCNSGGY